MKQVSAKKLNMGQVFSKDGELTAVTLVKLEDIPEDLEVGAPISIVGTSKGKGFAGVMKRHGFAGGPATHGQSDRARAPGSIGGTTDPGRVFKGKKMAGRMGGKRVTVPGLSVLEINPEEKIITISGSLPGPKKGKVLIAYDPKEKSDKQESEEEKNES